MPSLIPVCPSPTHPHAHTAYVAERNSNQGKDREKERLAWMSVSLHGRVCLWGHVYICGVSRWEISLCVWGPMNVEVGGREDEPLRPPSGVGERVSVWIPNLETSQSSPADILSPC